MTKIFLTSNNSFLFKLFLHYKRDPNANITFPLFRTCPSLPNWSLMEDNNCSDNYELTESNTNASTGDPTKYALIILNFHNHALLVLPIISIILNGFCLFIFFDAIWKKSILSTLLKYLSATEIVFNFSGFLYGITKFIDYPSISYFSKVFWVLVLQIGTFMVATSLICRNWTILHLAAYRFESICRPLSSRKIYTDIFTYKILWATYLVAALIAFPRTFEYESSFCKGSLNLKPGLLKYHWYEYGYQGSFIFIVQTGSPVIITSILSMAVLRVIMKMKKYRQSMSRKSQKTNNTVSSDVLMIFICFSFFMLETPSFFSKVLSSYLIKTGKIVEDILLATMANLLVYLDSVINIFVYIMSNPTFRMKLKQTLHIQTQNARDPMTTETVTLRRKETTTEDDMKK